MSQNLYGEGIATPNIVIPVLLITFSLFTMKALEWISHKKLQWLGYNEAV